jgi:pilus assembly protein CpaD
VTGVDLEKMIMRPASKSVLIALALTLGACGTQNRGMESVHQPVVSRSDYVFDVNAGGNGLAPGESERLAAWFSSMELGYGDRIAVDDREAYGAPGAREAVQALAARYGLLLSDNAPVTEGALTPGAVRVVVSRTDATVPGCPDWSRPSNPEFEGSTMSNYGCAINMSLAAMVANKEDLVRGQDPAGGYDARTAGKAIKVYRDRTLSGAGELRSETTKGGQ